MVQPLSTDCGWVPSGSRTEGVIATGFAGEQRPPVGLDHVAASEDRRGRAEYHTAVERPYRGQILSVLSCGHQEGAGQGRSRRPLSSGAGRYDIGAW
jgi:hypothetical protein